MFVVVTGASVSGSVMVVSWEVFMTDASKTELASGDMDLRPAVAWEAGGTFYVAVSTNTVAYPEAPRRWVWRERGDVVCIPHLRPPPWHASSRQPRQLWRY